MCVSQRSAKYISLIFRKRQVQQYKKTREMREELDKRASTFDVSMKKTIESWAGQIVYIVAVIMRLLFVMSLVLSPLSRRQFIRILLVAFEHVIWYNRNIKF